MRFLFASAGGGTSGFGGGGGGGGGGVSGSRGSGEAGWEGVLAVVILAILFFAVTGMLTWRANRRRRARVAQTVAASAEAADDDAWFAADRVQADAAELFRETQAAWDRRDRERLRDLVGHDLMTEWERRLDDFDRKGWHNHVEIREGPVVEYVGLVNREDDADDRVCVRITGRLLDVVDTGNGQRMNRNNAPDEVVAFAEYWTLERAGHQWRVGSIEQDAEGKHNLKAELIPTPWSDDQALRDEAVVEQAQAGAANGDASSLFSVDFADDAHRAALDLSLVDERFAPHVLEVAARRAVDGWAQAVDGDDDALLQVADADAVGQLLYGDDASRSTRLVVRGPKLEELRIVALDNDAAPPAFTVEARVRGRRYVENRDTLALVSGNRDRETTFTQRLELVLAGSGDNPWRVRAARTTVGS